MFVAWAVAIVVALGVAIVLGRAVLLRQEAPQHHHAPFDGTLYRVGDAVVAERRSAHPTATVIAMHGFVEDMRYFAHLYRDPAVQLVALTSAGYHVPVKDAKLEEPAWARAPDAKPGTIAYDAAVLVQALEHLPKTKRVRVHGHSRGGAVVLEAARLRPDLFADVEVVLEAPVLPQGKLFAEVSAVLLWLYPFIVVLWRRDPLAKQFARAYGSLDDPRKREILEGLPRNPKTLQTFVDNIDDILRWMAERDASIYAHVRRGVVLVPSKDRVLDAVAMRESASRAKPALDVVYVEGVSHFVTLDRPEAIPVLVDVAP